ncbi:hypothetical protein CWI40_070210 [Ordospora colligata]|nr:hypothetical protein CWI40_070210 [Ordospora colligata]
MDEDENGRPIEIPSRGRPRKRDTESFLNANGFQDQDNNQDLIEFMKKVNFTSMDGSTSMPESAFDGYFHSSNSNSSYNNQLTDLKNAYETHKPFSADDGLFAYDVSEAKRIGTMGMHDTRSGADIAVKDGFLIDAINQSTADNCINSSKSQCLDNSMMNGMQPAYLFDKFNPMNENHNGFYAQPDRNVKAEPNRIESYIPMENIPSQAFQRSYYPKNGFGYANSHNHKGGGFPLCSTWSDNRKEPFFPHQPDFDHDHGYSTQGRYNDRMSMNTNTPWKRTGMSVPKEDMEYYYRNTSSDRSSHSPLPTNPFGMHRHENLSQDPRYRHHQHPQMFMNGIDQGNRHSINSIDMTQDTRLMHPAFNGDAALSHPDYSLMEYGQQQYIDSSMQGSAWMNRKKRRNNPLMWQYIKTNQTFYPSIVHPSKYSSVDFVQGMEDSQRMYLGGLRRASAEKDNGNSSFPLFLNSNKASPNDFKEVIQNFKNSVSELDFNNVTVQQLKGLMKEFGLNYSGKKNELIERLQEILAKIDDRQDANPEDQQPHEIPKEKEADDFEFYFF